MLHKNWLLFAHNMKADVDGIAEQLWALIELRVEAELARRSAELDRREQDLQGREEAVRKRELALKAAAETPTPARASHQAESERTDGCKEASRSSDLLAERGSGMVQHLQSKLFAQPVSNKSNDARGQTADFKEQTAPQKATSPSLLFQAPKDQPAQSSEVSSEPKSGAGNQSQDSPPDVYTASAGTASQLKERFEPKASASSSEGNVRPYRHSAPVGKSAAEFSQVSAGTAGELKDLFEQKAQEVRQNSKTPERRSSWKAVQNKLELPNAEGSGLFRAHEAPFKRGVKTTGLGQPKERRSLQELLKADEMCQMAM